MRMNFTKLSLAGNMTILRFVVGCLLMTIFSYSNVMAQSRTLEGTVTSVEDGGPLPGVNVIVKGSTIGTVTDIEGKYSLNLPQAAETILFTFIGLKEQEVAINGRSVIDVAMTEDVSQLSEVVVTALGVEREERSLGYAVQEVKGEEFSEARETNVVNSLAGRVAGVQVTGASGNLGGSSRIILRGINSISGNNQPLFVIDGTPIDNSNYNTSGTELGSGGRDYGNTIQDINPDDIESMSILKGPSAAALYGSRASNGVILITTKKGKARKGIGVELSTNLTFNTPYILPDFQNEYGGGYKQTFDEYEGEPVVNYAADESWGPRMDGQLVRQWYSWYPDDPDFGQMTPFLPHPDNIRDFYETGKTFTNSVALSGGNETTLFRLSYTNTDQTGTLPNSSLVRNNLGFNGSTKLSERFTASTSINYARNRVDGVPGTGYGADAGNVVTSFNEWYQRQLDTEKLKNYQTADGRDRTWNIKSPTDLDPLYWENPYYVLNNSFATSQRERVYGNVSLGYDITDDLKVTGWARTDFYTDRRDDRIASGSIPQAMYEEEVRELKETNFEMLLQYNKQLSEDFSLGANFGANTRTNTFYRNKARTVGGLNVPNFFSTEASIDRPIVEDYYDERRVNSIYGSANVGFKDIIYLEGTIRNDWSSTLPAENNSYLYPSLTTSFVFSELLPTADFLSFGKIRAGWAQVGNDTDPYRLATIYRSENNYGDNPAFSVPNRLNNADLRPEITTSYEIGLDLRFFQGRLGMDVTYYDNQSTDQILPLDVSATSGFADAIVNAGLVTNKGWEVMLTGTPVETASGFRWDVSVNWAKNENRVVELAEGQTNYLIGTYGLSVNAREGQPYGVMVSSGYATTDDGQRIISANGLYVQEQDKVVGNVLPDWVGGVSNSFSFKGINLSALIDFRKGGDIYSVTNRYGLYSGLLEETVGNNDKGFPMRDPVADGGGIMPIGVVNTGTAEAPVYEPNTQYIEAQNYFSQSSLREQFVYDGSFIKFRELRAGYTFPKSLYENIPVQSISIAFVGRNLAVLHKNIPHVDPEAALGSGNIQGFENGQLPSLRSLGFDINIKL
ncbi:SusC/RagA family TonB-linked outer membrane protein [Catalinimonas niigatensis]|uniref:SusC/RagA family TonB-linked outer membrane protein n=1 Tax=Catalinimonas niigatensis TaxID=1397264 RepID=UPI0026671DF2|nr:SusC/RagA family TonB-linked outer membrane protein [Catalinimonas niigatensis]WPP49263.1 SusC/RagA family TonB-linked outer membrane protein [Catalinimonas niigatensis]